MPALEEVEALRIRHSEGVKNDDGGLLDVGGLEASRANFDEGRRCWLRGMTAAEEMLRRDFDEMLFDEARIGRD